MSQGLSRNSGNFWDDDEIGSLDYRQPMLNQGYGQPQVVIVRESELANRGNNKKHRSFARKLVYTGLAVIALTAVGKYKSEIGDGFGWAKERYDKFQDNRHERCMDSSASLNGDDFKVCFKPSSFYNLPDGSVAGYVALKTIHSGAELSTAATTTTIATDVTGSTTTVPSEQDGPYYYEIASSICSLGVDKGTAELDMVRNFIISNASTFSSDEVKIPTPDDPKVPAQMSAALAQIVIASEFVGQQPGDGPAKVTCP